MFEGPGFCTTQGPHVREPLALVLTQARMHARVYARALMSNQGKQAKQANALMRPKLLLIMSDVQMSARPVPEADALVHVTVPPSSWPWPWSCYHGHLHVSLVPPGP